MKKTLFILLALCCMLACKKKEENYGSVSYSLSYSGSASKSKVMQSASAKEDADSLYTQFGDYITSLTPVALKAKFLSIDFHNDKPIGTDGDVDDGGYLLALFNSSLSPDSPEHYADFTNNSTINLTPTLGGDLDNETMFSAEEIHFIYLLVQYVYLYQEVVLPSQYNSINIEQFSGTDAVVAGDTLKVRDNPLSKGIYSTYGINDMISFIVFGNASSSYVSATEGNNPIWGSQGGGNALRSNQYTELVFYRPAEGETFHINTEVSFNFNKLIQVYAGADNIPYTSDDKIVYRPKFWDRIHVNVTTN
jgi:hypothetical protein